ncbi:hypothetical protein OG946_20255 [Streptomyces sp. NBC_01808]|uniref:hypothetical protein n=1 Tax=Streptomyces sp. NBC_01808 TaxID=2975947 RepID=UPI002DDBEF95|nr:hypothetical protein [Streptomyces sp. NBC_01808]WSA39489.1 hypothetical protein OG946_20255 [Streptomyces sp. NBC_01808]
MARNIGADGRDVFRAVITSTGKDGRPSTWHEGPYAKPGAARARVSFWRNHLADKGSTVTGHPERALTVWRPVDDAQPDPEQYRTDRDGRPTWHSTDVDGDRLLAAVAVIPEQGPGIYLRTDLRGSSIPLDQLDDFIARLHAIADAARTAHQERTQ